MQRALYQFGVNHPTMYRRRGIGISLLKLKHQIDITNLILTKTIESRLKAIKYEIENIPLLFLCPISFEPMEDPVIVNGLPTHNFEKKNLEAYMQKSPTHDPFGTFIDDFDGKKNIAPNHELKKQIHQYVDCLEKIHSLQERIQTLEKNKISNAFMQIDDLGLSPEDHQQLVKEQRESQHEMILKKIVQKKLKLAVELQAFISLTQTAIDAEDKKDEEKLIEIIQITADNVNILGLLRSELAKDHPTIFYERASDALDEKVCKPKKIGCRVDRFDGKKNFLGLYSIFPQYPSGDAYSTSSNSESDHSLETRSGSPTPTKK